MVVYYLMAIYSREIPPTLFISLQMVFTHKVSVWEALCQSEIFTWTWALSIMMPLRFDLDILYLTSAEENIAGGV